MSKRKEMHQNGNSEKWLVFGSTGWLGGSLVEMLKKDNREVVCAKSRLEDLEAVAKELDQVKPTYVINAAGLTGRPNVDWCESHQQETIRVNVIGTLGLADAANKRGIPVTMLATGCIYEYDAAHPLGSGVGFKEEEPPNFTGSFYSLTKGMVDKMLDSYDNVLVLRVRMPLSDQYEHPRNFITKITNYRRVCNVANSMTEMGSMLPLVLEMTRRGLTGKYNFTNQGTISHNECLELYRQYVHPDYKWENFSLEEQAKILAAGRSNNELDQSKLMKEFPDLPDIKTAVKDMMIRMAKNKPKDAKCPIPSR